ncbi:anaphase-promoting complex APC subunit CDC26 domain-containing protein [Apiospora phragmitis]|uniref:Anaphase-promoting complex APC subunit CDC26 domain-containing protein n=1 Tax=Apiospora phragmitis TaxID=2905665 RepID=A0ABR1URH0_9PEZI
MLRRPPTALTLTSEDIASYEDRRAAQIQEAQLQARKQVQAAAGPRMQALYSSPRGRLHRETTPRLAAPSSPLHHQHQHQYHQQQQSPLHATPEVQQGGAGLSSPPEADANDWGYGSPDDEEDEEVEEDDDDEESDMGEPSVLDQRGQRLAVQRLAQQQQQQQQGASDPQQQLDTSDAEEQYNESDEDEDEDEEMADYDPDVAGAIQLMPRSMRPTPAAAMRQGSAEPPSRRSREPSAPANLAVTPVPSNHHITVTPAAPGGGGAPTGAAASAAASQIPQAPSRPTTGGGGGGNTRARATRGTAASAAAASAPMTRGTRTAGAGTGYVSTRGHAASAGEGRMTRSREERIGVSGAAGAAGSRRTARGG